MLHKLNGLLAPAAMERLTLLANHVIGSEPAAMQRLAPHAGRTVEVLASGWPAPLPPLPACAFRITPAGLLEWCGAPPSPAADLTLRVDAANPALLLGRALSGSLPAVAIDGDAALAGDVNWLLQNLRWDVTADLERIVGPALALPLARIGAALARGLHAVVQGAGAFGSRARADSRTGS